MGAQLFRTASSGDVHALSTLLSLAPPNHASLVLDRLNLDVRPAIHPVPEIEAESIFAVTAGGNTILHIAAEQGHLKFSQAVLNLEQSLVASVNSMLDTPLHCCAKGGHYRMLCFLIYAAREQLLGHAFQGLLRARNLDGDTVLHHVVQGNHFMVVERLIAVDYGLASVVNNSGFSPLYLAAMQNSERMVKALLKSSSCSDAGPGGRTALHAAVCTSKEITRLLLDWKLELGRAADDSGSIPLHYVAAAGDTQMAKILLEHDVSTAYIPDKDGFCCIHIAAHMGHVGVICRLLEFCPDSIELVDHRFRRSFVHVAVLNHRQGVMKHVLQTKALEKLLNQKDCDGNTPLHLAVKNGAKEIVYDLLSDRSVESNVMNNEGLTPLDLSLTSMEMSISYFFLVISGSLAENGATFSPQRLDHAYDTITQRFTRPKDTKNIISLCKHLTILSVLISTVTFTAGFTLPGGYFSDNIHRQGAAILADKYPFRVFLISDSIAMCCSLIATFRIIYAGGLEMDNALRVQHLSKSMNLLGVAFACMAVSFGMAALAVLVPESWPIGILVCVISFSAPFIRVVIFRGPVISSLFVKIARFGFREGVRRSRLESKHSMRFISEIRDKVSCWPLFHGVLFYLLLFLVIFLVALV
ncbi:putative ankyrin repeat-containing domain, PGG domain, ankyrin repeat-containing domain superfamily [Dioscorea sansibarensis]